MKAKAKIKRDTTVAAEGIDIPIDIFRQRKKNRDAETSVVANHVGIDKVKQWTIVVIGRDPHTFVTQYNPWPKNCQIIEITGQEDFSAGIGYKKCLNAI